MSTMMKTRRSYRILSAMRVIGGVAGLVFTFCANIDIADAQAYPTKTVRIVVPASPGGGTDIVTRMLAQKLSESTRQNFIVDNRPGAGQMLGTELVARAPSDGYTLLMAASALVLNQSLSSKPRFDTLKEFTPISLVASLPNVLVTHPSLPVRSVSDFVKLSRSKPGALNYSSGGDGTTLHLAMELFKYMSKTQITHIPYKGAGPATAALVAGHVEASMPPTLSALQHIRNGKLRGLAVTSSNRVEALKEIPTINEAGVSGYECIFWYGLLAPNGTSPAISTFLHAAVSKALFPEIGSHLMQSGAQAIGSTPDEFSTFIKTEIGKWSHVGREAKITIE